MMIWSQVQLMMKLIVRLYRAVNLKMNNFQINFRIKTVF